MTTHLIHAPFSMRAFNRWAGDRGLIQRGSFDEGYALHVLLSAMFGKAALQPFRLFASERRPGAALYAYTEMDEETLRHTAAAVATPDCLAVIDSAEDAIEADADDLHAGSTPRLRCPAPACAAAATGSTGRAARPTALAWRGGRCVQGGRHSTVSARVDRSCGGGEARCDTSIGLRCMAHRAIR